MAYLIALGILSLLGIVATLWLIRTDGYGPVPVDESRRVVPEPAPADPVSAPLTPEPAARRRSFAHRPARSAP